MFEKAVAEAKSAILSLLAEARLDEQRHLGFDKRLDNPILYCEDNRVIGQDERTAELKALLPKESK